MNKYKKYSNCIINDLTVCFALQKQSYLFIKSIYVKSFYKQINFFITLKNNSIYGFVQHINVLENKGNIILIYI